MIHNLMILGMSPWLLLLCIAAYVHVKNIDERRDLIGRLTDRLTNQ